MKRIAYSTIWLATALALTACGTNSSKSRSAPVSVPPQYGFGHNSTEAPAITLNVAENLHAANDVSRTDWWQTFGDTNLNALIERVLARNANLATAGLRLRRARLNAGLAFDARLPHADAYINSSRQSPLNGPSTSTRSHVAALEVSYVADLWGKLSAQHDQAVWQAHASAEDLESTRLALISETTRLYWTLAYTNHSIALGEQSLTSLERIVELVRAQYRLGEVSRLEVREAEQRLEAQRAAQSELEQQRIEVRNALMVLLDGAPWALEAEPRDLAGARTLDIEPGLPAELLSRRPDLRAAELRLRARLAHIDATRASYYPSFTLTGSVGGISETLSDVVRDPFATLGASLTLPFLRWNEMQLNVDIADADYGIAVNQFRESLYTALKEVDDALSARAQLDKQVSARQASLDAAIEVERLYQARYRVGEIPLRDWLDAQERRRTAELTLAQTKLAQLTNEVGLAQALAL